MDDTFMFKPKDYGPAIRLALNLDKGIPTKIEDYYYDEYNEEFVVLLKQRDGLKIDIGLEGSFVRSCHKAVGNGVSSWSN
jgi:hypothetical protein